MFMAAGCEGEATQCGSDSGSAVEPKRSGARSSPIVAEECALADSPKKQEDFGDSLPLFKLLMYEFIAHRKNSLDWRQYARYWISYCY